MGNQGRCPGSHKGERPSPLFVSTGSTSADVLTAPLLVELRRRGRLGNLAGVGGAPLRALGAHLFFDTTSSAAVGCVASVHSLLRHAGRAWKATRMVDRYFQEVRPALAILVDNLGINLRMLRKAHSYGIPTLYYVPPEMWSLWRWEIPPLVQQADVIAAIFRSEATALRERGGNARWIGHPLVDLLRDVPRPGALPGMPPTIGLFPGSRRLEVSELLPVLRGAAAIIQRQEPGARFVLCSANELAARRITADLAAWNVPVEVVHGQSHAVLARCDLLLTCSGTATLEAAILGVPMVVMYRLHHWLDRVIAFYKLYDGAYPFIALPNYLLRRQVVPELRNAEVTAERVAAEGLSLLRDDGRRHAVATGLAETRALLGPPGAIGRAADLVEEMLDRRQARPRSSYLHKEPAAAYVA
jgi:lipid-A-disaccharide synthase